MVSKFENKFPSALHNTLFELTIIWPVVSFSNFPKTSLISKNLLKLVKPQYAHRHLGETPGVNSRGQTYVVT